VLREIVAEMRTEPEFSAKMLSDLQLWGVDKVDGAGVTIAGQIVCTDAGRWSVQRDFNRRMKKRFEALGIAIYNPLRTLVVPGAGAGSAAASLASSPAPTDMSSSQAADPGLPGAPRKELPHGDARAAE
jgi:hypothetical protein